MIDFDKYQEKASEFATKTKTSLKIISRDYRPYFYYDKEKGYSRYVYKCQLRRGRKVYTFNFGQSIVDGHKQPSLYDILSTLTKYPVGTFDEFIEEYGYEDKINMSNKKRIEKDYKTLIKEWEAVNRLFSDVLDELRDIM